MASESIAFHKMEARTSTASLAGRLRPHTDGANRTSAPLQREVSKRFSAMKAQPTPPDNPIRSSTHSTDSAMFHNYLRAFCSFDPPTQPDDEALRSTVRIRPGDLILVHSVHANGWADGTVLTTNTRGWLPTNYCETYDHPYMRSLLSAMTQFWDLLVPGEDANFSTFVRQDYLRPLIAGVRYLLEHADCLHRDAALIQRSAGLRRLRKGLLADLSTLVQIAKRLQDIVSEPFATDVLPSVLDELMAKACKVITRSVGFADMLAQEGAGAKPLPPINTIHARLSKASVSNRTSTARDVEAHQDISERVDSAKEFQAPSTSEVVNKSPNREERRRTRPQSGLVSHRLSTVRRDKPRHSATLASEQLAQAHDLCISHIGGFIGLYLHPSSPATELVAMTQRLLSACKAMLEVVDKISAFEPRGGTSIQQSRTNFQLKLEALTVSTESLIQNADRLDDDIVMLPERTNHLVNEGTSLIRAVGDCVVKIRKVIEQIGDFDLDNPPVVEQDGEREEQAVPGASAAEEPPAHDPPPPPEESMSEEPAVITVQPSSPEELPDATNTTDVADFGRPLSTITTSDATTPRSPFFPTSQSSLPIPPLADVVALQTSVPSSDTYKGPRSPSATLTDPTRKCSVGTSTSASIETRQSSVRDSSFTAVSEVSTRATTPDHRKDTSSKASELVNSFGSVSSVQSQGSAEASIDTEAQLLQKTYANELTLNKEGQVTGGSLPALVEQLTTADSAPDAQFVTAFFVTFRSFATPRELAQALIHRFDYVGDDKTVGTPVRLRIYNAFKSWLGTYWNLDLDREALGDIRYFALHKLKPLMGQSGDRLLEEVRRLSTIYQKSSANSDIASTDGKSSMSIVRQHNLERDAPEPVVTKSQLNALRKAVADGTNNCSVVDFEPLELARQLTVLASRIFCDIQSDELLSLEWNKKDSARAEHVRNMCILNTDVAHVVGDTILTPEDAKKRALVIKHWSKVATRCLELNNYESLMAIMCSLNSSVVQRLKRTWEVVNKKTKATLEELNSVVDFSRNQTSLRRRLENVTTPCLPFLGVYLTDLTMLDAGNPKLRELPGTATTAAAGDPLSVINFDKHLRMAKIVTQLQKFQVPYALKEVPELQAWLKMHLERMRGRNAQMVGDFHRRSLHIEPKRDLSHAPKLPDVATIRDAEAAAGLVGGDRGGAAPQRSSAVVLPERPKTSGGTTTMKSFKPRGQTFEFLLKANFNFKGQPEVPSPESGTQVGFDSGSHS